MKRIAFLLALSLVAVSAFADGYRKPVVVKEMAFTAKLESGKVVFTWKKYLRDDFLYYKLVKSATNADPVYPDDGYIFYGEAAGATAWVEEKPEAGRWYYRLCIITKSGDRWVSPVIVIDVTQPASTVPTSRDFAP